MDEKTKQSLEAIDRAVGKATMSRAEHVGAQNILSWIGEELTALAQLRAEHQAEHDAKKEPEPPKPQDPIKTK